jgi:alkylation response protein AidB-like acyl-CoA dehydrogenase
MTDTRTTPLTEAEVEAIADEFIAVHGHDDETEFLGAQFDAGLAWIGNRVGDGGLGAPGKMQKIVDLRLEAAGRRGNWMRNPMGIGMCGPSIAAHGTDEQRRKHLRRIWTAEDIWCQLFSEPSAGSDVATLATRAERDGDEWTINGQKVWTSRAHHSRYGLLLARTNPDVPKHNGITAFLLDMETPGVEVRPLIQITGESDFCEVFFTDAVVPDHDRLGEVGDGWRVAVTTLMNERVSIAGDVIPRGSGPISAAVRVFRDAPDRSPARRDQLVQLWLEAEVLRLLTMRAQATREAGTPGPEGSVAKLAGALLSQRIADFAVTNAGPLGMLLSNDGIENDIPFVIDNITRSFLQVPAATIAGGTTEIMLNIIGERVLGLPGEARADKNVPWKDIPK